MERANTVLSDNIENFAIEQGPDAFLDAIMHTIVSALDVHSVEMWRWEENGLAHLHRVLEHGIIVPGAQADHPNAHRPTALAKFPWTREVIAGVQTNHRDHPDPQT